MPFTPKDWQDKPSTATPINSFELERIEAAIQVATATGEANTTAIGGKAPTVHTHTAVQISDSTGVGRSILVAVDAAAVRAAAGVVDATAVAKGLVQLAGDLGGSAAAPTVPGLTAKAPLASPVFTGVVETPAVKITGGSPGVGKVLTGTDGAGNANWQTPAGGGSTTAVGNRQTLAVADTYIAGIPISAGTLQVGSRYRMKLLFSYPVTPSTTTIRVRYGAAGSTADTAIHTATFTGNASADTAEVNIEVSVDVINAATGAISVFTRMTREQSQSTNGFHNTTGTPCSTSQTTTLDTTAARTLGVSVQESGANVVLVAATLQLIRL